MTGEVKIERLSHIAKLLGSPLIGADTNFHGVSSDSRTIREGELFVALQGPNFNGGEYLEIARQRGAVGAIVQGERSSVLPQIVVDDTLTSLGMVAAAWREQFEVPLLAITGSNGKTTVKEMTASILQQMGPGTVTHGNLNNEIGVPLTLLRISPQDRWVVIEMGASSPGDIALLSRIAQPTVALVNNVGTAHLQGFGSVAQIAKAKGEIYSGLRADGVALINRDLPQAAEWMELAAGRKIETYGCSAASSLVSAVIEEHHSLRLSYQGGSLEVELPLLGSHNRLNAVAAAALSLQAGASLEQVKMGLELVQPVSGRLERKEGRGGAVVIDDSYNANPESMSRAIDLLSGMDGRKVLVLGDMGELGRDTLRLHYQVGLEARLVGIDRLCALGSSAVEYVSAFGSGATHFEEYSQLLTALEDELKEGVIILVKGSRFMKMERLVEGITIL